MTGKPLTDSQRKSLAEATRLFHENLPGSPALEYLNGRGLAGVAERYQYGYVDNPPPGFEQFTGMLAIPYLTGNGPVHMKFRRLDDGHPRYLNYPGLAVRMYNVPAFHKTNSIAICEGELDAATLDGIVGIPAVGVAGAQNWHKHYAMIFEPYSRVWVFYDNDMKEDGSNPGFELARLVQREVPQAVLVRMPANVDVNAYVRAHGPQATLALAGLQEAIK